MTRPNAPCLTADYYTYSTYSPRDDYYGEFDSKMPTSAPLREEPRKEKLKNQSIVKKQQIYSLTHCICLMYCFLAFSLIAFNCFMYYNGIRNKFVVYSATAFGGVVLASVLMHIGIIRRQPFTCIPFVVLRTLETFICAVFLGGFSYALFDSNSNVFVFFLQCSKMVAELFSAQSKFNLVDATFQLCLVGWCISLLILSVSVYVCRVSFNCIMSIADEVRRDRYRQNFNTPQARFAGDEFYYS